MRFLDHQQGRHRLAVCQFVRKRLAEQVGRHQVLDRVVGHAHIDDADPALLDHFGRVQALQLRLIEGARVHQHLQLGAEADEVQRLGAARWALGGPAAQDRQREGQLRLRRGVEQVLDPLQLAGRQPGLKPLLEVVDAFQERVAFAQGRLQRARS